MGHRNSMPQGRMKEKCVSPKGGLVDTYIILQYMCQVVNVHINQLFSDPLSSRSCSES